MIRTLKGALAATAFFASAQASAQTPQQVAAEACISDKPFVVIDTFKLVKPAFGDGKNSGPATMDFNGDLMVRGGEYTGMDGVHGDIVAAIAGADGRQVIAFQASDIMPAALAESFADLATKLEDGTIEKPGAIIASLVVPLDIERTAQMMAALGLPSLDLSNVDEHKQLIVDLVLRRGGPDYAAIHKAFSRIDALGIPIFVAAGNYGPAPLINMLALFPGAHAVGALGPDGLKAEFTNDSSLVKLWRKGSFTMRQVEGGIDLNGDDKPEFFQSALTGGSSVALDYNGKAAKLVGRSIPGPIKDYAAQIEFRAPGMFKNLLPAGLYPTAALMDLYGRGGTGSADFMKRQGPWMHHPSFLVFKENADGTLVFDPNGTGDPAQRASWDATSASAPNICGN